MGMDMVGYGVQVQIHLWYTHRRNSLSQRRSIAALTLVIERMPKAGYMVYPVLLNCFLRRM